MIVLGLNVLLLRRWWLQQIKASNNRARSKPRDFCESSKSVAWSLGFNPRHRLDSGYEFIPQILRGIRLDCLEGSIATRGNPKNTKRQSPERLESSTGVGPMLKANLVDMLWISLKSGGNTGLATAGRGDDVISIVSPDLSWVTFEESLAGDDWGTVPAAPGWWSSRESSRRQQPAHHRTSQTQESSAFIRWSAVPSRE